MRILSLQALVTCSLVTLEACGGGGGIVSAPAPVIAPAPAPVALAGATDKIIGGVTSSQAFATQNYAPG